MLFRSVLPCALCQLSLRQYVKRDRNDERTDVDYDDKFDSLPADLLICCVQSIRIHDSDCARIPIRMDLVQCDAGSVL